MESNLSLLLGIALLGLRSNFSRHVRDGEVNERSHPNWKHSMPRVNNMNWEFFGVPLRQYADKPSRCNVFANQPIREHADAQAAQHGFAQACDTLGNQQG